MSGKRKRTSKRWLVVAGLLLAVALGAGLLWRSLPDVRVLLRRPPATTAFIELRRQEAAQAGRRFVLRWTWRSLEQISPYLAEAVVMAEDARFWKHDGVDWDAMEKAAEKNWQKRRFAVGGSTITQQLAKNLYLSPSKDPLRKLRELLIAQRLDAQLPKERVLELYLNVVEWGDGVFGAEAAANRWYASAAADLSPAQAARLAVALPNPRRRTPAARSPDLDRKAGRLIRVMWRAGLLDEPGRDRALADLGLGAEPPIPPPAAAPGAGQLAPLSAAGPDGPPAESPELMAPAPAAPAPAAPAPAAPDPPEALPPIN